MFGPFAPSFRSLSPLASSLITCSGECLFDFIGLNPPLSIMEAKLTQGVDQFVGSRSLLFHVFGALAQFERALISERVTAGLQAARDKGRIGGRPRAISSEKLTAILEAVDSGMSKAAICRTFGVKRTTLIETLSRLGR